MKKGLFLSCILALALCGWIGCEENTIVDGDSQVMFVDVNVHPQTTAEDPCMATITMWVPNPKEVVSAFKIKWWGFEWRTFPVIGNSYSYEQVFRSGTENIEVEAQAWDENGNLIAEFQDTGKYVGCMGSAEPEKIELGLRQCIDPADPLEVNCFCAELFWDTGTPPFKIYSGQTPTALGIIDTCDCFIYGAMAAPYFQVKDSEGNESNIASWTPPSGCP